MSTKCDSKYNQYAIDSISVLCLFQAQLRAIQMDPGTYLDEPPGSKADFEEWKAGFDLEGTKGDISELLVANVEVRGMYTQMVKTVIQYQVVGSNL